MGGAKRMQKKKSSGTKILVTILILLIIIAGALLAMKIWQNKQNEKEIVSENQEQIAQTPKTEEKKEPKTFAGNERPIAVMIDNNINAMHQAGFTKADIIYEIIVEGGETRLMMVFKNQNLDKIGPLRSARHYFLDYALENDAIYVHYGQSPQAKADIKTLAISDINGINESSTSFWRDNTRYAPHNAITNTKNIQAIIKREGFRTTSNKGNVLNYVAEEIELEDIKETIKTDITNVTNTTSEPIEKVTNLANSVTIPYSAYNTVKYTYNKETKTYTRYSRDTLQKDWNTNKAIEVKNIIVTKCANSTIDSYGRQTINNIKTLDGYYITNGKYIPIKCEKTSRSGKTKYKDLDGNEIEVNDGKTFIQICPLDSKISFK